MSEWAKKLAGWLDKDLFGKSRKPIDSDSGIEKESNNGEIPDAVFMTMDEPLETEESNVLFAGVVVDCRKGYCFLNKIKRGDETLETNGDVFCPQEFSVGSVVQFEELNKDPERKGRLRAERPTLGLVALQAPSNPKALALAELIKPSWYHKNAKDIANEEAMEALKNQPFIDFIEMKLSLDEDPSQENLQEMFEKMLQEEFPHLVHHFEVNPSIKGDIDEAAEARRIAETVAEFASEGMTGQALSIPEEYERFCKVRTVFKELRAAGQLCIDSLIPVEHWPAFVAKLPVWYWRDKAGSMNSESNRGDVDARINPAARCLLNMHGKQRFADFFLIYNRRTRTMSEYDDKRDLTPPRVMQIMKKLKGVADFDFIAAPHHGKASHEWQDSFWLQNIDPAYCILIEGFPYIIKITEWSFTGLPTMAPQMIADTMHHLESHKNLLNNFRSNTYWWQPRGGVNSCLHSCGQNGKNALVEFAEDLLEAYRQHHAFEWLNEKWDLPLAEGESTTAT
jgi:hypothetical protein